MAPRSGPRGAITPLLVRGRRRGGGRRGRRGERAVDVARRPHDVAVAAHRREDVLPRDEAVPTRPHDAVDPHAQLLRERPHRRCRPRPLADPAGRPAGVDPRTEPGIRPHDRDRLRSDPGFGRLGPTPAAPGSSRGSPTAARRPARTLRRGPVPDEVRLWPVVVPRLAESGVSPHGSSRPRSDPGFGSLGCRVRGTVRGRGGRGAVVDLEGHQGGADGDCLALLRVQGRDDARVRGREVDEGLGRLDLGDDLVELDVVARVDVPTDDVGLGEAFPEVGEAELAHRHHRATASTVRVAPDDPGAPTGAAASGTDDGANGSTRPRTRSTPSRMRSRSGR